MSELIRREDVQREIQASFDGGAFRWQDGQDLMDRINALPTASPWRRVEDDPPDEKTDAIFYYEWTGISGTVYKETSITSLDELMALGCRPIAWMDKPEPPKEDA